MEILYNVPAFAGEFLGAIIGVPLGVLLAHYLSQKQRLFQSRKDAMEKIVDNYTRVFGREDGSVLDLHNSVQSAMFLYSNKKDCEIISAIFDFTKEPRATNNLDKVDKILNLMIKKLYKKKFEWMPGIMIKT